MLVLSCKLDMTWWELLSVMTSRSSYCIDGSATRPHLQRTNIGIALISDPRVLFLDEPTSGLDSYSANEVVELVKGLSQQGVTVVATIHSPTATAFAMFDRILMLARGRVCYFGDNTGKSQEFKGGCHLN